MGNELSTDKTTTPPSPSPPTTRTITTSMEQNTSTSNVNAPPSSSNDGKNEKSDENKRPHSVLVATNVMPEQQESPLKKNKNNPDKATTTTTTTNLHASTPEDATSTASTSTNTSYMSAMENGEEDISNLNFANSDSDSEPSLSLKTSLVDSNDSSTTESPDSNNNSNNTGLSATTRAAETKEDSTLDDVTATTTTATSTTTSSSGIITTKNNDEPSNSQPMDIDTSLNATTSTSTSKMSNVTGTSTKSDEPMEINASRNPTNSDNNKNNMDSSKKQVVDNNTSNDDGDDNDDDPHEKHRRAMETTRSVLEKVSQILEANPQFCSEQRQMEWNDEIQHRLQRHTCPQTTIGVLGNTGVGKSSLLNALLDEASVLPTSGSRGCTAAVVELRFNQQLLIQSTTSEKQAAVSATTATAATATTTTTTDTQQSAGDQKKADEAQIPVYTGVVQFISLPEWDAELKVLLAECSTHEEKTIYARVPEDSRQPDAAAAWAKINQVYGRNFLEQYHSKPVDRVYDILMSNPRVKNLLTAPPGEEYKSVMVEQGLVNATQAAKLVASADGSALGGRLKRAKKKWAKDFRAQINGYVYRNNGTAAQTWPLIRKVVLHGPWAVLQTGACLVDLPGVRDANAARAKVAENYLQHLNEIWIVAPIQRAVDDGTAKELLGESFKRRLLMDGNYSSVSFICTQTDDIEATETMRDHSDVAEEMGLFPEMNTLNDELIDLEKTTNELKQQEEDLMIQLEEAKDAVKDSQDEIKEAEEELSEQDDDEDDEDEDDDGGVEFDEQATRKQRLETLQTALNEKQQVAGSAQLQLEMWRQDNKDKLDELDATSRLLQRQLKGLCARVRNKYSTTCLQQDFRAGLDEMTRRDDEDEVDPGMENLAIPDDWQMQVFAISSNDYLKVTGIKPSTDGPPNTFSNADETQIPALKAFVHETTAKHSVAFIEDCVNTASDLIDRVKLVATESSDGASSRMSRKCRSVFELEMMSIAKKLEPVVNEFKEKMQHRINTALKPSLEKGAKKGQESALETACSWGSKSRRTRTERGPEKNGLYWSTYFATVRRGGVYVSGAAGEIDFNQELCDPMEKEFSADWQRVFDASLRQALRTCEQKVLHICTLLDQSLASALTENGIREDRLTTLMTAANRSCRTNLTNAFQGIAAVATNTQRDLNRSLLPLVKKQMEHGYTAVLNVPGGGGKFARMKMAMEDHCSRTVSTMFDDTTVQMLAAIGNMVEQLSGMLAAIVDIIEKTFSQVYSVLWDDGQEEKASLFDPVKALEVRECRDRVLPEILALQKSIIAAMGLLGIEREQLDLEMMGVESWEDRIEKKRKEAEENGLVVDLCDDDGDDDVDGDKKPAAIPSTMHTVKREQHCLI